jgi:hypothetical protein
LRRKVATLVLNATFLMTPPGMQNPAANRQCERNATDRTVSSRRQPRKTLRTALAKLSSAGENGAERIASPQHSATLGETKAHSDSLLPILYLAVGPRGPVQETQRGRG